MNRSAGTITLTTAGLFRTGAQRVLRLASWLVVMATLAACDRNLVAPATQPNSVAIPGISVLSRTSAEVNGAGNVAFVIYYSDATQVTLNATDVDLDSTSDATCSVSVTGAGVLARTITLSSCTGAGTVTVALRAGTASNAAGASPAVVLAGATVVVDSVPPASAMSLMWVQSSPAATGSLTAIWTPSTADDRARQQIQLFDDSACGAAIGPAIELPILQQTAFNFTGNDATTYTYQIISIDTANNHAVSSCSPPLSVSLIDLPTVAIGAPSRSPVASGQSVVYTVSYARAASVVFADPAPVTLNTTGNAACSLSIAGSGNTQRTVTLSQCTGDGTIAISVASGTASNVRGSDVGAGPGNPFVVDNTAPAEATNAGWLETSPSDSTSVTARWTTSAAPDLAGQAIQLYTGDDCTVRHGLPVDLASSSVNTYNFTASDTTTFTYRVSSTDAAGNARDSACSAPLIINTAGLPALGISAPSASRVKSTGTVAYPIVYTNADAISLLSANIGLIATGGATCAVSVVGAGSTTRIVQLSNCTGNGTVAITVAGGTAMNLSGSAAAAGPSAAVTVDNAAPVDATGLGWTVPSPATFASITAAWIVSIDSDLAVQSIQIYANGSCVAPNSASIDLPSATTTAQDFTGEHAVTYSYRVTSADTLGNTSVSGCSTPLLVNLAGNPSISLTESSLPPGGTTGYAVAGGSGALSVSVSGAGSIDNPGSDGTYSAPYQCNAGVDTLTVTDELGGSSSVSVDFGADASQCQALTIGVDSSSVGAGSSTSYYVSGGQGSYSVTVDNGSVDNGSGSGSYYSPSSCSGGTATLTVYDGTGAYASTTVSYDSDGSGCYTPVSIYVDQSYFSTSGSTTYSIWGGSGSYSIAFASDYGGSPTGSIDNYGGSGTYGIGLGPCGSGASGTDVITVYDADGSQTSASINWYDTPCGSDLSISVDYSSIGAGSSTSYYVSGGQGSYSVSVDAGYVDNGAGSGTYYSPSDCSGGTATLTVSDGVGSSVSTSVSYASDGSQCYSPVALSIDQASFSGDGSTNYWIYGGSGNYSISFTSDSGGSPAGSIDNYSGSGAYSISAGSCGTSGADVITVYDNDGSQASTQVSWATPACYEAPSVSLSGTDVSGDGSTLAYYVGGTQSLTVTIASLSGAGTIATLDNPSGSGTLTAPNSCDAPDDLEELTVSDTNGNSASATFTVHFPACS